MSTKALELFQAFSSNQLPLEGGYIISSFLDETSTYSKYEIIAYNNVKSLYLTGDGLTFQSDGNKVFVLVEPPNYHRKHVEPLHREPRYQVPHRFSELDILTAKNQTKVMISAAPVMSYSSFTVLIPTGMNFSFIFYNLADVLDTVRIFFAKTLNKEANIPSGDAAQAARKIVGGMQKFTIWND